MNNLITCSFSQLPTYFDTQQEKKDVEEFCNQKFARCDILFILQKYVTYLSTKWSLKWPEELKGIYIEAYEMYR